MERELYTVPVKAPGCRGAPHEVASACWRCLLDQSPWHPPYSQGSKCGAPAEDFRSFGRGRLAAARAAAAARAGVARAAAARAAAVRAVAATAVARAVPVASLEPATVWAATDGRGLVGLDGCEHLFWIHTQSPPPDFGLSD